MVLGSLSFQAEWSTATNIDQIGGGPVFVHGMYAFASYFLTGEYRRYVLKDGVFGITRVRAPFLCLKDCSRTGVSMAPAAWELTVASPTRTSPMPISRRRRAG